MSGAADTYYMSVLESETMCRGVVWGIEGSRLEAGMKSHKSEVAIT